MSVSQNSFDCRAELQVGDNVYGYFSLERAAGNGLTGIGRLPVSMKVLLENLLRHEDDASVRRNDIQAFAAWLEDRGRARAEIAFRPTRVLMQDFTGVPALVDLAAMRDAAVGLGTPPGRINPQIPVDLVIDHSVMVDHAGVADALRRNMAREYERNGERYAFLKWGQDAFENFRVVPPGAGICHQVNLEYLAQCVREVDIDGARIACPDTCVGTDSHTTMINGLSVLGWGVGGIEAEAAMLGQPISMLIPEVVGFELRGSLREGVTATDLVLRIVEMLREKGVVGRFVEFHGDGLANLSLEDRATIANMAPEYGATCGFFPIDGETLTYLRHTGRPAHQVALVEAYARAQGLWRDRTPIFSDTLALDLAEVGAAIAGPKRPQDRVALSDAAPAFEQALAAEYGLKGDGVTPVAGRDHSLRNGDIVIAAITSCTNTSNPSVLMAAGLLARKARARGLTVPPWVKTSLAPGSQVVTDYLDRAGLSADLDALGFHLVGYGCTTCIGNSGPLPAPIAKAIDDGGLAVASVLSGNRNFEGRVNPHVRANYLASPPLVVAYALAGSMRVDLTRQPLGHDQDGQPVHLAEIWPTNREIAECVRACVTPDMFLRRYRTVFAGNDSWRSIGVDGGSSYCWQDGSSYVRKPPYFTDMPQRPEPVADIEDAAILGLFGTSVTTDHISPAGTINEDSAAGRWLSERQISPADYNSYGSRRGNHEVMVRGTFANIRVRNRILDDIEGGYTRMMPDGDMMSIFEAAEAYHEAGRPLVVVAGEQYGTGSSRDWAAKGTLLLGIRAVMASSFERIHRSNLVGMGVLPLQFGDGSGWEALQLTGTESVTIRGLRELEPAATVTAEIRRPDGGVEDIPLKVRIDTGNEMEYFRHGGILRYVLRQLAGTSARSGAGSGQPHREDRL